MPKAHKAAGAALSFLLCLPMSAQAADTVLGVFVAEGRTTTLKNVYVTLDRDPGGDEQYQTILAHELIA